MSQEYFPEAAQVGSPTQVQSRRFQSRAPIRDRGGRMHIKRPLFRLLVPLPPIATQQAILVEIETEQALVAANREFVTRFVNQVRA